MTICPGIFTGAPEGVFVIVCEAELLRRLKLRREDFADQDELDRAVKGFHQVDGIGLPVVVRRKINMEFGCWLPIDRDDVRGMPECLARLNPRAWLFALDELLPGIAGAARVLVPSSMSRFVRDGRPVTSKNFHLLVQVADPREISRVWPQLLVKAFQTPLSPWDDEVMLGFMRPLYATADPDVVIGHRPWSIFDVTTGSPERLLFEGAPVSKSVGLEVAPPAPEATLGERLDLSKFVDVEDTPPFEAATGDRVHIKRARNGALPGRVVDVTFTAPDLSFDQELITKNGPTTVAELQRKGVTHVRCQTPWRPESVSFASFFGVHKNGTPFVYDSGTSVKHVLPGLEGFLDLTHDKLALDLGIHWAGDARYVALWGRWLFWFGSTWLEDEKLDHMTRTRAYLRGRAEVILEVIGGREAGPAADALRNKPMVAAVADLARSNPDIAGGTDEWDRDPFLCGAPSCTVDLRTGETREPERDDLITKRLAVDPAPPGTAAPLWQRFLVRVTDGDTELIAYLQRLAGYCLTGDIGEHVLAFAHGAGANGKGVFFGTLADAMGAYAVTVGTEMLMVSIGERHPTEIARLRGARLALGSEIESNQTWAEAKIKKLTGGDRLQGRFMRQDFFEFDPQFKLIVFGNRKPSLRGVDEAIRRRLHLIPFTVTIPAPERDPQLREKLRAEWPAILRWAIDGCLEWQRVGLRPPARVVAATEEYLGGEDLIERWREDCLVEDQTRTRSRRSTRCSRAGRDGASRPAKRPVRSVSFPTSWSSTAWSAACPVKFAGLPV